MNPNSLTHKVRGKSLSGKKRKRKGYSKVQDTAKLCSDEEYFSKKLLVRQGWLDKQSKQTKLWKRRWCILEGLELKSYREKKDESGNVFDDINTPTTIDLSKCQSCEYTDEFEQHTFVFYLQCGALERYFFKAASHTDRLEWMLAIQRILRQKQRRDIQKSIQTSCTEHARISAIENGYASRILAVNQKVNKKLMSIGPPCLLNQHEEENPNPQVSINVKDITFSKNAVPSYNTTDVTMDQEDRPKQCCLLL